jgi:hypothetical protein
MTWNSSLSIQNYVAHQACANKLQIVEVVVNSVLDLLFEHLSENKPQPMP